ncbi:hypothetical protein FK498_13725, partial [Elioraea sp. Yellowstone]
ASAEDATELRRNVTSPGGTTAAAQAGVMGQHGLPPRHPPALAPAARPARPRSRLAGRAARPRRPRPRGGAGLVPPGMDADLGRASALRARPARRRLAGGCRAPPQLERLALARDAGERRHRHLARAAARRGAAGACAADRARRPGRGPRARRTAAR